MSLPAIQLISPDDIPRLLPLVEAYWQFEDLLGFDALAVEGALRRLVGSPDLGSAWIARSHDSTDPVGYLLLVYVFSLEHGGLTAEVDELFVAPRARGVGVGRKLLETAEAACVDMGCRHLSLQVGSKNKAAREFYRSIGFAPRTGFNLFEKRLP